MMVQLRAYVDPAAGDEHSRLAVATCPPKVNPLLAKLFGVELDEAAIDKTTAAYFLLSTGPNDVDKTEVMAMMWLSHDVKAYKLSLDRDHDQEHFDQQSLIVEKAPWSSTKPAIGINHFWAKDTSDRHEVAKRLIGLAFGDPDKFNITFRVPVDRESFNFAQSLGNMNENAFLVHY